jgi:hypothetical protein
MLMSVFWCYYCVVIKSFLSVVAQILNKQNCLGRVVLHHDDVKDNILGKNTIVIIMSGIILVHKLIHVRSPLNEEYKIKKIITSNISQKCLRDTIPVS